MLRPTTTTLARRTTRGGRGRGGGTMIAVVGRRARCPLQVLPSSSCAHCGFRSASSSRSHPRELELASAVRKRFCSSVHPRQRPKQHLPQHAAAVGSTNDSAAGVMTSPFELRRPSPSGSDVAGAGNESSAAVYKALLDALSSTAATASMSHPTLQPWSTSSTEWTAVVDEEETAVMEDRRRIVDDPRMIVAPRADDVKAPLRHANHDETHATRGVRPSREVNGTDPETTVETSEHADAASHQPATDGDAAAKTAKVETQQPPPPPLSSRLHLALKQRDAQAALRLFRETIAIDHQTSPNHLQLLIYAAYRQKDFVAAFDILRRSIELDSRRQPAAANDDGKDDKHHQRGRGGIDIRSYRTVIDTLRYVDVRPDAPRVRRGVVPIDDLRVKVQFIERHLLRMEEERGDVGEDGARYNRAHILLPRLACALASHPSDAVASWARPMYLHAVAKRYPLVEPTLYERMMGLSSLRRAGSKFLPCHMTLEALVAEGHRPDPQLVQNLLQNQYPFDNYAVVMSILQSIMTLHMEPRIAKRGDSDTPAPVSAKRDYLIDLGTLESIMATQMAEPDLCLIVWDLAELLGLRPTEGMYENAIRAFFKSKEKQDHCAFAVLAEMEAAGFEPSRALVESISRSIHYTVGRLTHAYYILINGTNGANVTTASLNCILSACARRGLVDTSFSTFEDFSKYGVEPNDDTFSYLLEALAKDATEQFSVPVDMQAATTVAGPDVGPQLEAAETVISLMEEAGIDQNQHTLHNHLHLLCSAGKLEEAQQALDDFISEHHRVSLKSIVLVATKYAQQGNYGAARNIATWTRRGGCGQTPTFLSRKIHNIEKGSHRH